MAERRMFAKTIIDSDAFLDMPLSSHALYFHLSMRADDDGFINNPKKIQRMIGASDDDLKLLIAKDFIIPFESGIVVIKHWRIHNYIRNDRYKSTVYEEEKSMLDTKDNNTYTMRPSSGIPTGIPSGIPTGIPSGIPTGIPTGIPSGIPTGIPSGIPSDNQSGYQMETQVRLGKDSIGKDNNIGAKSAQPIPVEGEISPEYQETGQDTTQDAPKGRKRLNLSVSELKSLFKAYTNDPVVIDLLLEWCDIRKVKGGVNTKTAIASNLKKMDQMASESSLTVPEYLEEVIAKAWLAFYPIRNSRQGSPSGVNNAPAAFQFPPLQTPMRVFDSSRDEY